MKIIIGLGNVGKAYDNTYHNVGFAAVDFFAKSVGVEISKKGKNCFFTETKINGEKVVLAKPTTYMNLSGNACLELLLKFKAKPEDLLVVFDDVDLDKGTIRFRANGSGGTHNGAKHIVACIGENFNRIKIGVKSQEPIFSLADYVLSKIDEKSNELLLEAIKKTGERISEFIKQ